MANVSCTDYDGDGIFTVIDVVILNAYVTAVDGGWLPGNDAGDINIVQTIYDFSYEPTFGAATVVSVPNTTHRQEESDLNDDGSFNIADVILYYCYVTLQDMSPSPLTGNPVTDLAMVQQYMTSHLPGPLVRR